MSKQTIAVVTSGRADYAPLRALLRALQAEDSFELQLVASGGHLSKAQGETLQDIEADGFVIVSRILLQSEGGSRLESARALGAGVAGFAEAFDDLRPDLVIVLGDRFEILAAAMAATMLGLPLAHLCGGDLTAGAIDDVMRHAVTKMAHLHFVSNEASGKRVRQMGESPQRVFVVGSPALDDLRACEFLNRSELETLLTFTLRKTNILATYHPVTMEFDNGMAGLDALLASLEPFGDDTGIVFTAPNVDTGGAEFMTRIAEFVAAGDNRIFKANLGATGYFSMLRLADIVVGNSSSGLTEAPSLGTPTVNIGERQRGRIEGPSVVSCVPTESAIRTAIERALRLKCPNEWENPYGDGQASGRIVAVLKSLGAFAPLVRKSFHDIDRPAS